MKTTQIATTILLGAASLTGYAQDPGSTAYIKPVDDKKFAIYLNDEQIDKTLLSIKDQKGYTLYAKSIKSKSKFAKVFNLSKLENGVYDLVLEDSKAIQTIPVVVEADELSIDNTERSISYKPYISHKNEILDLMVFSPEKGQYEITIFDGDNSIVYNESINNEMKIEKRFNLSGLKPGNYNVLVSGVNGQYTYSLPIQ